MNTPGVQNLRSDVDAHDHVGIDKSNGKGRETPNPGKTAFDMPLVLRRRLPFVLPSKMMISQDSYRTVPTPEYKYLVFY